jgi:hypothetical protein
MAECTGRRTHSLQDERLRTMAGNQSTRPTTGNDDGPFAEPGSMRGDEWRCLPAMAPPIIGRARPREEGDRRGATLGDGQKGWRPAWNPGPWLGVSNRGSMTASGIYPIIARRGRECGIDVFLHRFRHPFSHTWLDHGGARSPRARRSYDRVRQDTP